MFVNPIQMIEQGYIRNLVDLEKQVQPNAVDFTVDQIQEFVSVDGPYGSIPTFYVGESEKAMRKQQILPTSYLDGQEVWALKQNSEFDIVSDVYVEVPEGYAAMLILRSTFVRNGCWLASGLYDSGFKGNIGAVLHTGGAAAIIEKGTRIGQIIFVESGTAKLYAGGYNTEDGQHWTDKVQ
jgi:deoxycytidine triphosphate deaminase